MGKTKQPQYRIVAADLRSPRDGRFIEIIGQYNPRQEPSVVNLDTDKATKYLAAGAQPTERVAKLLQIAGVELPAKITARSAPVPPRLRHERRLMTSMMSTGSRRRQRGARPRRARPGRRARRRAHRHGAARPPAVLECVAPGELGRVIGHAAGRPRASGRWCGPRPAATASRSTSTSSIEPRGAPARGRAGGQGARPPG